MTSSKKKIDFKRKWIKENVILLKTCYPKVSREKLEKILEDIYDKNIKTEPIIMKDTYRNVDYASDSLTLTEFCDAKKPLMAGNGVLIDRDGENPAIKMLNEMGDRRKQFKDTMKTFDENSYEFGMYNLFQNNEKVKMNAWYGINGAPTSLFFNLECATAITGKGRHLISVATIAFDTFLGGNIKFLDMNDCLYYIKNILSEQSDRKFKDKDVLDHNISKYQLKQRLINLFENKYDCNEILLGRIINNLDKEDINRIYYKNNLMEFCSNSMIKEKIREYVLSVDVYVLPDGEKAPEELKNKMAYVWKYLEEYVVYNHQYVDRVYRVLNKTRKSVLVIDTDSNMLDLYPWVTFVKQNILSKEDIKSKNEADLNNVIIFTMCFHLSRMIRMVLEKYLKYCNVKKERRHLLDMKNEYLFSTMLITEVKKNYASVIEYKEGKNMHGKVDMKGLPIRKSSTNKIAAARFEEILENDILKTKHINLLDILVKLNDFEQEIRESLNRGEQKFLKPVRVSDIEAYKDPLSESGIRGAMAWEEIYPEKAIVLPESFYLVKLTVFKPDDLYKITDENVREIVRKYIFENEEPRIRAKGLYILAIPRDEKIPDWAIPCIDVDTIVEDTMRSFMGVMRALGISNIYKSSNSEQFSNYIMI